MPIRTEQLTGSQPAPTTILHCRAIERLFFNKAHLRILPLNNLDCERDYESVEQKGTVEGDSGRPKRHLRHFFAKKSNYFKPRQIQDKYVQFMRFFWDLSGGSYRFKPYRTIDWGVFELLVWRVS